jgi:hypothetical protein
MRVCGLGIYCVGKIFSFQKREEDIFPRVIRMRFDESAGHYIGEIVGQATIEITHLMGNVAGP